ncbi:hypothetical protein QUA86_11970 [Microcoleus sp. F6_B6]
MTAAPICGYAVKLRLLCLQRKRPASPKNLVALPIAAPTAIDSYRQTDSSSLEAS